MRSNITSRRMAVTMTTLMLAVTAIALTAHADPYHTVTVDGTITADGLDWPPADFVLADEHDYGVFDNGDFYRLYTTWDADSLYIGADYLASNRTAYILIDLDLDSGLTSGADLDSLPVDVSFTDGRTIDLVIARTHGLFNDPGIPRVFQVLDGDGTVDEITDLTHGAQSAPNAPPSRLPAWYQTEIAIPWSVIYPDGAPAYATFDAVGVIMDTGAGIDGEDTAPDNPGEGAAGTVTIENMHTSILDADGDGGIDSLDASVSGQISMPGNPGDLSATITATLLDWAGGDLDDAVSRTTTAPGESDYRLGRLPAGTYELAYTAPGYFPVTESITLAAGETVVDHDLTLDRATTVTGSLVTELTPSFIGQAIEVSYELRSPDGTLIESIDSVAWATFNTLYSDFTFYVSESGTYSLTAWADFHQFTDFTFDVIAGEDVSDLAFVIPRAPLLEGTLSFVDGPGHAGVIYLTSAGEDAPMDSLAFEATGGTFGEGGDLPPFYLSNGSYDVLVDALGYQLWTTSFTVPEDNADINLGDIALTAVRADILRLIDETGAEIVSLSATKSIPDSNVYFPEEINLEAVDQTGRRDLFDLDAKLTGLPLTARKLDDRAPNSGGAWFLGSYATDNVDDIITTVDIIDGEARVWLANDAIEVLRVFAGPEVPDPLKQVTPPTARFMVGFNAPRPTTVVLNASQSTLMAHADSSLTVSAQLYDSAGNLSKQEEIVSFVTVTGTAGTGTFSSPTLETNANGYVDATLRADKAGELLIDCSVVVDNQVLEVRLGNVDGEPGPLPITVTPGPTEAWRLSTSSSVSGIDVPVTITAQTVDAKGNETLEADATVQLTAFPITLGAFTDAAPVSNESGRAVTEFNPAGEAGVVTLTASSALYDGDEADLELRGVTVISDPSFDQEPEDNQSFEAVDLTAMVIDNDPNGLMIEIPFASDWAGLQFHLLFETNWDEAGAEANPFDMPVVYGHAHKPDYVLNLKYDQSYGDLRKWNEISPDWRNWWDDVDGEYLTDWAPGVEIQSTWATFESSGIKLSIPWGPFGGRPDSLRCELYVTQVEDGNRSALDSVPSDDTLNLNWDPDNPDDPNTNWPSMTESRTLTNWSPTYSVKTGFPTPPSLGNVAAAPASLEAGALFVFSARVTDAGDGVGDVLADLAAIAGPRLARMYDDGEANHGDNNAGDGVYSLRTTVSLASPGGEQYLHVMAYDGDNLLSSSATDTVNVIPQVDIIVQAGFTEDEIGDDHGPNQSGVEGLFYTYPTNSVFVAGAFDLLGLNIYETVASVGGEPAEMIAFEVSIGDYPDPADPHTADWNPPYGDLNIQKIDIMIDNGPGGATRGLPSRRIDFQRWNAWDYAIIIDGWYKAVVPSLGQNTEDAWRENALRTDADIQITGDFERDVVTALVAKSALGNPTPEDIERWSIAVVMCSHDGDADFGGVRWVNESRSEWNQGGGHYQDRDSNVMDLLLVPGADRDPGRTQEEMLNYESELALRRLEDGETPCAVEMSAFEDTGPPVIKVVKDFGEVMLREPLIDAPIAFSIEIVDDNEVGLADFNYRSTKPSASVWDEEGVAMGYVGNDLWSVDLPAAWLDTALVVSPVDDMRYVEFEIYAEDIDYLDYEATGTQAPVTTVQIAPAQDSLYVRESLESGDITLRHVDGARLRIDDQLRAVLIETYQTQTGSDLATDSLSTVLQAGFGIANVAPVVTSAPPIPRATPLGIYRSVSLDVGDSLSVLPLTDRFDRPATLSLHYTETHLPPGRPESKVAMYEYLPGSDRWILIGGHVNLRANTVSAAVDHAGVYGLFWTDELQFETSEVISGITISPNPFSPNGDGLYDRTNIGFYLTQEATVTVEVYNIEGRLKTRLQETFPYSGEDDTNRVPRRVEGLIWDGTGTNGEFVPYGIYILRLIVTYNQAGGQRTIRSNHAVAVIR